VTVQLRKRPPGEPPHHADPEWLGVAPLSIEGVATPINRYFLSHPNMVLGTWGRKNMLYNDPASYSVKSNGDLAEQLRDAVQTPAGIRTVAAISRQEKTARAFTPPSPLKHIGEGSFFLDENRIVCQSIGGQSVPVRLWRAKLTLRQPDGQAPGRPDRPAGQGPPRAAIAENEAGPRSTAAKLAANSTGPTTASPPPTGDQQDHLRETEGGHVIRRMPNLVKFRKIRTPC